MKQPKRVLITGAAGNIGYALAFRIAAGDMLGKDQPVILHLMETLPAWETQQGLAMELRDCAFPLLHGIVTADNATVAFKDIDYALLVGARPRQAGMERSELLDANGAIFAAQGKALDRYANRDVRVLVVGNPANTNALIAMKNAPGIKPEQFTALTRLDHNRAMSLLAEKTGAHVTEIRQMTIWGNHSATQYPDLSHTMIREKNALSLLDRTWYETSFIEQVQQRGAAIIRVRRASSAASAASATIDHMRSWVLGTDPDDWVSMAVPADGSYGIDEGIIFSYPCRCIDGRYEIVQGLSVDEFSQQKMDATEQELREEAAVVSKLFGG